MIFNPFFGGRPVSQYLYWAYVININQFITPAQWIYFGLYFNYFRRLRIYAKESR